MSVPTPIKVTGSHFYRHSNSDHLEWLKIILEHELSVILFFLFRTYLFPHVLVVRFSLHMIDEQTKTATAQATVQMRNEYARALAKEVQKLWDSNVGDIKKLKEALTAQIAELEQNVKEKSDFQIHFVQALAVGVDGTYWSWYRLVR